MAFDLRRKLNAKHFPRTYGRSGRQ